MGFVQIDFGDTKPNRVGVRPRLCTGRQEAAWLPWEASLEWRLTLKNSGSWAGWGSGWGPES